MKLVIDRLHHLGGDVQAREVQQLKGSHPKPCRLTHERVDLVVTGNLLFENAQSFCVQSATRMINQKTGLVLSQHRTMCRGVDQGP